MWAPRTSRPACAQRKRLLDLPNVEIGRGGVLATSVTTATIVVVKPPEGMDGSANREIGTVFIVMAWIFKAHLRTRI
jgi:hypothetical protein